MNPKQKAEELKDKFRDHAFDRSEYDDNLDREVEKHHAIECALICVEEIINLCAEGLSETKFWKEVKKELEGMK
jgi:hypothetical protein